MSSSASTKSSASITSSSTESELKFGSSVTSVQSPFSGDSKTPSIPVSSGTNRSTSASLSPPLTPDSSPNATALSIQASAPFFSLSAATSYVPAMSSSTALLLSITISVIPTETSSAVVPPPQVINPHPKYNRSTIIAAATISAVAFLGLLIIAVMLCRRPSRNDLRGRHTRRAFMIHPRAEDEDEWKQATMSPSTSPTADTPTYSPIPKPPHYIVHSRTSLDHPRAVASHAVLWAATHLEQPLPLSRGTTGSPPSTRAKYTYATAPVSPPLDLAGVSLRASSSSVPLL
ncbi:hypothetical protein B0H16DRAFT_1894235 [Mycena metata]|uniref:Uncharacterized protein n=1 Tax=Mycena metata TaxID=1033252 RepID=A0AAD7HTL4_9AGAR|nr:hypothetical protein B0H16DRAFT_1894235 [Mycena metata]